MTSYDREFVANSLEEAVQKARDLAKHKAPPNVLKAVVETFEKAQSTFFENYEVMVAMICIVKIIDEENCEAFLDELAELSEDIAKTVSTLGSSIGEEDIQV